MPLFWNRRKAFRAVFHEAAFPNGNSYGYLMGRFLLHCAALHNFWILCCSYSAGFSHVHVRLSGAVFPVRLVLISSTFLSAASRVFSAPLYAPSVTITVRSSCFSICLRCFWINWLSLWLFCSYWYSVTTEPLLPTDSSRLATYPRCLFLPCFGMWLSGQKNSASWMNPCRRLLSSEACVFHSQQWSVLTDTWQTNHTLLNDFIRTHIRQEAFLYLPEGALYDHPHPNFLKQRRKHNRISLINLSIWYFPNYTFFSSIWQI